MSRNTLVYTGEHLSVLCINIIQSYSLLIKCIGITTYCNLNWCIYGFIWHEVTLINLVIIWRWTISSYLRISSFSCDSGVSYEFNCIIYSIFLIYLYIYISIYLLHSLISPCRWILLPYMLYAGSSKITNLINLTLIMSLHYLYSTKPLTGTISPVPPTNFFTYQPYPLIAALKFDAS